MKSCKNFTILLIFCAVSTNVVSIPLEAIKPNKSTMGRGAQNWPTPASTVAHKPPTTPKVTWQQPLSFTSIRRRSSSSWSTTSTWRQELPSPEKNPTHSKPVSTTREEEQPPNSRSERPHSSGLQSTTNTRRQEVSSTVSTPMSPMNSNPVLTTREGKQPLNSTTERPQSFGPWNATSNRRQEVPSPTSTSVYNSPVSPVATYYNVYMIIFGFPGWKQSLNTTSERPQPSDPRNATNTRRQEVSSTVSTPRSPINSIPISTSHEGNKPPKSTSESPHSSDALSTKSNQTEIIIAILLLLCISCIISVLYCIVGTGICCESGIKFMNL